MNIRSTILFFIVLEFIFVTSANAAEIRANILSNEKVGENYRLTIDKGSNHGIEIGQNCKILVDMINASAPFGSGTVVRTDSNGRSSIVLLTANFYPAINRDFVMVKTGDSPLHNNEGNFVLTGSSQSKEKTVQVDADVHEPDLRAAVEISKNADRVDLYTVETDESEPGIDIDNVGINVKSGAIAEKPAASDVKPVETEAVAAETDAKTEDAETGSANKNKDVGEEIESPMIAEIDHQKNTEPGTSPLDGRGVRRNQTDSANLNDPVQNGADFPDSDITCRDQAQVDEHNEKEAMPKLQLEREDEFAELKKIDQDSNSIPDQKAKSSEVHFKAIKAKSPEKRRIGRFALYDNGVIVDEKTSFEWLAGPDENTSWDEANAWIQGLLEDGGAWRFPTRFEIMTLYEKGEGTRNINQIFPTTGNAVWTGESKSEDQKWYFCFWGLRFGRSSWAHRDTRLLKRSFAVRTLELDRLARDVDVIKRHGTYLLMKNGIVKDVASGLEWIAGPDEDMQWDEAQAWINNAQSLEGGKWRLPTCKELEALYYRGIGRRNMTPLLNTSGFYVWSGETRDAKHRWFFNFYGIRRGGSSWCSCQSSLKKRVFGVR